MRRCLPLRYYQQRYAADTTRYADAADITLLPRHTSADGAA